jgi:hypothetical protein
MVRSSQGPLYQWLSVRSRIGPDHLNEERKERAVGQKQKQDYRPLTRGELEKLAGEPLPERAAMSLINANVAAPVNLAAALNVLSDNSTAVADATQTAPITQTN